MYLIDKENNRIKNLTKRTFGELGFRERQHLQEWIANKPEALGEELLIIQKEFTSTVLWLMNYKLRIQCFKATPFALDEQLFLTLEQIIPTKDTEDFIISMAGKTQDEIATQENLKSRHHIRFDFWTQLLPKL